MGWTSNVINQLVIQGTNSGLFIYNGVPSTGTLIGSWASNAGVDPYGNPYPAGINVLAGSLQGVSIENSVLIGGTIFNALVSASQIQGSAMLGGNISETVITFDSGGGNLFLYTSSTTTQTFTTTQNMTAPALGVPSLNVSAWGGDAGGGGGGPALGGEGGGGAEFAGEVAYPNHNPGGMYQVTIGQGGNGGTTGNAGTSGQQTSFDNTGVIAGGGLAGSAGIGGLGGNISTNSVHYPGGNGGSNPGNWTSSAGGGGRAGSTGPGGNGANPTANASPGSGGSAGTGTGGLVGSNGVVAATNGNSGNAGGSGAGASPGATQLTKSYRPRHTYSYYGAGVGNGLRNTDGSMFQGDPNVPVNTFPGDQYSFAYYGLSGAGTPSGDFAAYTVDSVQVQIQNGFSWYGTGCYLIWGYSPFTTFGSTGNLSGATTNVQNNWISRGALATYDLTFVYALPIQLGTWSSILLGPSSSTSGGSLDLYNYGYFNGGPSLGPVLTVKGHIGAGNQTAGNGSGGKVIVTYQTTNIMVGALSPVVGTDGSNAFGAGYTGAVQAFHPGSSPKTVETWQTIGVGSSGLSGTLRVKKIAESTLCIMHFAIVFSYTASPQTFNLGTLPTAYVPTTASHAYPCTVNGTPSGITATLPRVFLPATSAAVQLLIPAGTGTGNVASGTIVYPLD